MTSAISQGRTRNYIQQIKGTAFFKAMAVAASFCSVPLMIRYLGQEGYGVWSMLLSVMSWVVFFDLGIGTGLRNRLAEALAKDNIGDALGYISAGYSWLGMVALLLFFLVVAVSYVTPWGTVFNTRVIGNETLRWAVIMSGFFVLVNFWIGLVNQLFNALQRSSWVVLGQFLTNFLSLTLVFVLTRTTESSLISMVVAYGVSMVTASLVLSVGFFRKYPELLPRPSLHRRGLMPLLVLGGRFFAIQLAMLVIFSTDRLMIGQLFGPDSVAQYDVVFKLFSALLLVHGIIVGPLWSAYTDAYHRNDLDWIRGTLSSQLVIFACMALSTLALGLFAKPIIALWIGADFPVPHLLVLAAAAFVVVSMWNNVFGFVLGGINKVRLGSYYTVLTAALNIPVSYYLAVTLKMGVAGIMMGTTAAILLSAFLSPLQVYYFIYTGQHNKFLSGILR